MIYFILILTQLLIPAMFISWLWSVLPASRSNWLLMVIATTSVVAFSVIVGAQAWISVYVTGLVVLFFVISLIRSYQHLPKHWFPFQWGSDWDERIFTITHLLMIIVMLPFSIMGLMGYSPDQPAVDMLFPLQNGMYHIGHGGSHPTVNYHNVNPQQAYALDISRLNGWGNRLSGIHPTELSRYEIFGDTVYSPCAGSVDTLVNDLSDLTPPQRYRKEPAGNHVVLQCADVNVYLAHLKKHSIMVTKGDSILAGTPIAQVGNSGNTTEPHLHIHAIRNDKGIPLRFNGRFLVRNSLVWR